MSPHNSALVLFGILICLGCNVSSPPDEPPAPTLPPLEANFPYEKLGSGKIVFNRIGPPENNYSSVYVADINSRRSWAIEVGGGSGSAVSPDGSKIAFSKSVGDWDVHVMNIDGSGVRDITNLAGQDWFPSWAPDSLHILFYSDPNRELYRQSPISNPGDLQVVRDFFQDGVLASPAAVSPSLQLAFAFAAFGNSPEIYSMGWDGTSLLCLTSLSPLAEGGYWLWSPCWSPDGSRIAFMKESYSMNSYFLDIFTMDADGGNLRSVASIAMERDTPQFEWLPQFQPLAICWSPDGTKLLFNKIDGDYCLHLYVMNTDGTEISQVTFAAQVTDRSVSWSR